MFVDHEAWTESEFLPEVQIINPGKNHPLGLGATRLVVSGGMEIKEDVVGFRPPEYFAYATHNGSLPVNDFGGELFFEEREGGLYAKYTGGFNPKYPGTGWFFKRFLNSAQKRVFVDLEKAYGSYYCF